MGPYDNRRSGNRSVGPSLFTGLPEVGRLLRSPFIGRRARTGRPHYQICIGGKHLAYCYIRKNACSSFKRLFVENSHRPFRHEVDDRLQFMKKYHSVRNIRSLEKCDHILFVCRDPGTRLVSAFTNKFIVKSNNRDIFSDYYRVTGKNPETATFRTFVTEYLRADFSELDPHVIPQSYHLLPIQYTDAIPLTELFEAMSNIIGAQMAQMYFAEKTNDSASRARCSLAEAPDLTAAELEKLFIETGSTPRSEDFLAGEVLDEVMTLYEDDYALYQSVSGMGNATQKRK